MRSFRLRHGLCGGVSGSCPSRVREGSTEASKAGALVCVLFASCTSVSALDPSRDLRQYCLDVWQQEQGLPQNTAHALLQTKDGYIWIGTQEGLVRFDGVQFTVFDRGNSDGLSSNHIQALCERADGSLWIGTFGGGLVRLADGTFTSFGPEQGLPDDDVTTLASDPGGRLWLGTGEHGAYRLEGGSFRNYSTRDGLLSDQVNCLRVDGERRVWVGTAAGLSCLREGRVVSLSRSASLAGEAITALVVDRDGHLWAGTKQGLVEDPLGKAIRYTTKQGLPHDLIICLYQDSAGAIWIGTAGGVARFRDGHFASLTSEEGLSAPAIEAFAEDREGSVWIGTNGGGLDRLREGKVVSYTALHGLINENIYSVCGRAGGGLWVGTENGQVYTFHDGRFTRLNDRGTIDPTIVRSLCVDHSGGLWIATERGLYRYANDRIISYGSRDGLPDSAVRVIFEDSDNRMLFGTEGAGLCLFEGGVFRRITRRDGLANDQIREIIQDRNGDIWIGTYGGLSRLRNGTFQNFTTADGLSSNHVRSLYADADGNLWIGTYGGGLYRYRNGRFNHYSVRDGLYNDVVYQIVEDSHGRLWMCCNKGIFSVAKSELDAFDAGRVGRLSSLSFGRADGMRSSECNGGHPAELRCPDGRIYFTSLRGLVELDPDRIPENRIRPPVRIESLLVDHRLVSPNGGADLPPGTRQLEIHYAALSFLAPEKVRFSYKLEGIDDNWVDAGSRRVAYYMHVPPGRYEFRVIACNNDGVWNREGAHMGLSLHPYFHQTAACRALIVVGLFGSGLGAYLLRVKHLKRRERILQGRVDDALARAKILGGLLPICASCKKIRDDRGYWKQLESYIREHSEAEFSHGICPECSERLYPGVAKKSSP